MTTIQYKTCGMRVTWEEPMNQPQLIGRPKPDPIGQRFAIAEARIAETIEVMRNLLTKNNDSLAEILRAIAGEKPQ